ncbi:MAG: FeoB-associated Cys-rich membrane protein [Ruminococcus sp.]|nr:FeoB-associated Cys-rich membrane protein [Ruminococcus sp.]
MLDFLMNNLGTIIVLLIVAAVVFCIVFQSVRKRRKGQSSCSSCGCGCSGCASASICHPPKK